MGTAESFADTYEILGKLGEGSGGVVYKAYHKRLRQEVVLKQVKKRGTSSAADRREVDILKKLHHSYLPQVFDFIEWRDIYCYELYSGKIICPADQRGAYVHPETAHQMGHAAVQCPECPSQSEPSDHPW